MSPSGSLLPVATIAPWFATYTPSTGAAARPCTMAASVRSKKPCSTGPHGWQPVSTSGTGVHGPVASIAATNADISREITPPSRRASASRASPAR